MFSANSILPELISVMGNLPTRTKAKSDERPPGEFPPPVWKNVFAKKVFLFDRLRDLR